MAAIVIFWLIFSILVGYLGKDKKIGFGGAFILSLLLSPLIGLIIVLASGDTAPGNPMEKGVNQLIQTGDAKFSKGDYEGAIMDYQNILNLRNKAPQTNFKLALIYSMKGNKQLLFKHLQLAFEQGYKDYSNLQQEGFKFLREQPEYKKFVENGYRFLKPDKDDSIEKLEKLAKLKKEGFITDEEFQREKAKIINQ